MQQNVSKSLIVGFFSLMSLNLLANPGSVVRELPGNRSSHPQPGHGNIPMPPIGHPPSRPSHPNIPNPHRDNRRDIPAPPISQPPSRPPQPHLPDPRNNGSNVPNGNPYSHPYSNPYSNPYSQPNPNVGGIPAPPIGPPPVRPPQPRLPDLTPPPVREEPVFSEHGDYDDSYSDSNNTYYDDQSSSESESSDSRIVVSNASGFFGEGYKNSGFSIKFKQFEIIKSATLILELAGIKGAKESMLTIYFEDLSGKQKLIGTYPLNPNQATGRREGDLDLFPLQIPEGGKLRFEFTGRRVFVEKLLLTL